MLHPGLYEQVINNALTGELAGIPEARKAVAPIDKAEASKVLAQYLADVVQKGLDNVLDNGGEVSAQIELTNRIIGLIQNMTKEADFAALGIDRRAEQLLALLIIHSLTYLFAGGLDSADEPLRRLLVKPFLQGFHVVVHGDPSFGSQHTYHNSGRKAITFSRIIFIYSGAFLQMFL